MNARVSTTSAASTPMRAIIRLVALLIVFIFYFKEVEVVEVVEMQCFTASASPPLGALAPAEVMEVVEISTKREGAARHESEQN
jgi:hypothetical protein